ncbi:Acetyltransferase (GNAT) family protein [Caulifigura coniformis]|uniref:Acetyltransferase (GNAT) family protein n=1 Tax=Caulifigura coniformis TaxID=2527983 RepID=A0A517SDM9_9PLAN|nr:GNAT family N-acetyltransferase [Caulifigura coniformis]QDT54225.1 Acetyltransferase (GNAT) family protein [Caulifigura coniformis]
MAEEDETPVMPTLETERLVLTPLTADDAAAMYPELSDSGLYEHMDADPPESEAQLAEYYRQLERRVSPDRDERWLHWIIRSRATGEPMGFVRATVAAGSLGIIAYTIFRRFHRQGFAGEATRAAISHLLDEEIEHFIARVNPRNEASRRLLTRLGFEVASSGTAPGTDLFFAADRQSLRLEPAAQV